MADRYDVGDVAELEFPITVGDDPPVPTDPSSATLTITPPTGEPFDASSGLDHPAVGLYRYSLELTEPGVWGWHLVTTSPAPGAESGLVEVYGRLTRDAAYLEAYARLRALTEAELDPTLSPEELEDLLRAERRVDRNGRAPLDDGWESTYHVNRAAAAGWRRKAGKLAKRATDVSADDGNVKRSQAYQHCLEMARLYSRQGIAVAHLTTTRRHDSGADRAIVNLSEARLEDLPGYGATAGGGPV